MSVFEQELYKTSLYQVLVHEAMNQCVVWLICFLFLRWPGVCYCRHAASWGSCCGKGQPNWSVPYGSVSSWLLWNICNWIGYSLFPLSSHSQFSDLLQWRDSFGNSCAEVEAEWVLLIPCLPLTSAWTLRQVSWVWEGKHYPSCKSSCWYIHKFLSPNTR